MNVTSNWFILTKSQISNYNDFSLFIVFRIIFVHHRLDRNDHFNVNEIRNRCQQLRRLKRLKRRMQILKTRVENLNAVRSKYRSMKELQKRVETMKNRFEKMKHCLQRLSEIMTTLQELIILLIENTQIVENCAKYVVRRIDVFDNNV